jgi:hypothetical protein
MRIQNRITPFSQGLLSHRALPCQVSVQHGLQLQHTLFELKSQTWRDTRRLPQIDRGHHSVTCPIVWRVFVRSLPDRP